MSLYNGSWKKKTCNENDYSALFQEPYITLFKPMEYAIKYETVKSEWRIIYTIAIKLSIFLYDPDF